SSGQALRVSLVKSGAYLSESYVRSADRRRFEPDHRYNYVGFRLSLGQIASTRQGKQAGSERSGRGQLQAERSGQRLCRERSDETEQGGLEKREHPQQGPGTGFVQ